MTNVEHLCTGAHHCSKSHFPHHMHWIKHKNLEKKIVGRTHSVKYNGKDLLCKLLELTHTVLQSLIQGSGVLCASAPPPVELGEWYCAFLAGSKLFSGEKLELSIRLNSKGNSNKLKGFLSVDSCLSDVWALCEISRWLSWLPCMANKMWLSGLKQELSY